MMIYKNVHCLDFASLYPNIIRQCNLSPEFKYPIKYNNDSDLNLVIPKTEFVEEPIGLLPQMATVLLNLRKEYRSKGMEAEQLACKIAVNSMYGVLSQKSAKFILGGTHIASTVTYTGRTILHNLVKLLPKYDIKVIYGKTDSIFVITDEDYTKEDILNIAQNVTDEIVEKITGFKNKYIKFDYEEYLDIMLLLNKNNYVKVYEDGNKKLKGASFFNSKSSDYEVDVTNFLIDKIIKTNNLKESFLKHEAMIFLTDCIKNKHLDYFAINHKPRENKINIFDSVDYMLDNDINIEYGFNHRAVICDYDGNDSGVLVYPQDFIIKEDYRVSRRWLEKQTLNIINKFDLKPDNLQSNLDKYFI